MRVLQARLPDFSFLGVGSSPVSLEERFAPPNENASHNQESLVQDLIRGGFLINDDLDELALLQVANRVTRFAMDSLTLTVVTTHLCNFACSYCYESRKHPEVAKMGLEVQDRLVEFVQGQKRSLQDLSVTWFGGEPLLGRSVIQRLSVKFIDLCLANNIAYHADIITNGYLLTREIAAELRGLGVQGAQVTLDGPAQWHNQRRPLASGKPSFERIFHNLVEVHDLLSLVVRMNLDRHNLRRASQLIDFLAAQGMQDKIQLSFSPVHNDGRGCRERAEVEAEVCGAVDDRSTSDLLGLKAFAKEYAKLHNHALAQGFPFHQLPRSKANACMADLANAYVVEPDGRLHKCWGLVTDPEQSIGTVFDGTRLNQQYAKWLLFDIFKLARCRKCKVLPICMGWCPAKIIKYPSPESCSVVKHSIEDELKLYYKTMK